MLLLVHINKILQDFLTNKFLGEKDIIDEILENEKILDLIVPEHKVLLCDMDNLNLGIYFPKEIRKKFTKIAIIGIKEEITSEQRTIFLDSGGDDLISSDYSFSETLAIINARRRTYESMILEKRFECKIGDNKFIWDQTNTFVLLNDKSVLLSKAILLVLLYLLNNKGKICSKENIFNNCVKDNEEKDIKIVDVHIHSIRNYFKQLGINNLVRTVYGIGYIID